MDSLTRKKIIEKTVWNEEMFPVGSKVFLPDWLIDEIVCDPTFVGIVGDVEYVDEEDLVVRYTLNDVNRKIYIDPSDANAIRKVK